MTATGASAIQHTSQSVEPCEGIAPQEPEAIAIKRLRSDLLFGLTLRGLGAVSSFALAWLLAQFFGARTVGLYQIGFTTVTLLATVAVLSQDVVLVRKVAPLLQSQSYSDVSARFRGARRLVLCLGLALAVTAALLAFPLAEFGLGDSAIAPFIIALAPAVVLLPLMRVHNALLRCLGRIKLSQSLEGVLYTTFAILGLGALWLVAGDVEPIAAPVMVVIGLVLSVIAGYLLTRRHLLEWPSDEPPHAPEVANGAWIAAGPIATHTGHWAVLLLIAAQLGADDAGIFRIGVLTVMLMQLIKTSFATMAGPYLAQAAYKQDRSQLHKVILVAGGIGLAIALPVGLVAILAPEWVMGLFGEEFVRGALALQLLAVGQLLSVAMGPVGASLIMQNRERIVLGVEVFAVSCAILTAALLVPTWGLAGGAMGLLVADILRNALNGAFTWFR
ncbi:MAG: lipopolysaccharide biosynthesis protein [Erythrobacter sp.]